MQQRGSDKTIDANATQLIESGIMPTWLTSLPYTSALLKLPHNRFTQLPQEEQVNRIYDLETKIQFYEDILNNPELWTPLYTQEKPVVYPLSLMVLP